MTERPDLTAAETKPDVLERLWKWEKKLVAEKRGPSLVVHHTITDDISEAADVIRALRDTCDRRLAMINELKRELADLRPEECR